MGCFISALLFSVELLFLFCIRILLEIALPFQRGVILYKENSRKIQKEMSKNQYIFRVFLSGSNFSLSSRFLTRFSKAFTQLCVVFYIWEWSKWLRIVKVTENGHSLPHHLRFDSWRATKADQTAWILRCLTPQTSGPSLVPHYVVNRRNRKSYTKICIINWQASDCLLFTMKSCRIASEVISLLLRNKN